MFAEFRTQLLRFLASDKRALFNASEIQGRPVSTTAPADGESLAWSAADNQYVPATGGGGGAPTTADFVVKTANAGLSAERVLTDSASVTWDWTTPGQVSATAETGSFVTATAKAPRRIPMGIQYWNVAAPIGATATNGDLYMPFNMPIYVNSGEFIAVTLKFLTGTATASQSIWYHVTFDYGWE